LENVVGSPEPSRWDEPTLAFRQSRHDPASASGDERIADLTPEHLFQGGHCHTLPTPLRFLLDSSIGGVLYAAHIGSQQAATKTGVSQMSTLISRRALSGIRMLLVVFLFLATVPSLMAQTSSTGALTGRITDSSGAVVPNAALTLTSVDTAQSRTATTGADGTYTFGLLPPGNYQLKIEASGFKGVQIPSVTVLVTETEALDRALEVGATTQTITVEGAVETIQTTSSAMGAVLTSRIVTELPLNTRNYTNLLTMSAGANANVTNASLLGKGLTYIATNGAGYGQNNFAQDGVDVTSYLSFNTGQEGFSGGTFVLPIPDDIQEFKVQTSSYDAGYGRNPGANINVITKTGTNDLHGSGFEFFRNTALNANTWFNNFFGQPKGVLNSNQYGGTLGGPIKKDKLFFFVSYQETSQKNGISAFGQSLPTLAPIPLGDRGTCPPGWTSLAQCSAATTGFVNNLAANMCPGNKPANQQKNFVTNQGAQGIAVLCAPTGASPLANINPLGISILQLQASPGNYFIPSGCNYGGSCSGATSTYASHVFSVPAIFKDHNALGNWDYVVNSKETLSGRYQWEQDPLTGGFPSLDTTSAPGVFLPNNGAKITHYNQQAILKLTSILSQNVVNQANVAYQRISTVSTELTPFTNSQVGITDLVPGFDQLDYITTPSFSFGAHTSFGVNDIVNQFQGNEQISWEHGKHSLRFGVGGWHVQVKTYFPSHAVAQASFNSVADFLIGLPSCQAFTGVGTCGPNNAGNTNGFSTSNNGTGGSQNGLFSGYFRLNVFNAYVQDDVKVTPRLTVNVGLRWEYDGNIYEGQGLMSTMWPSLLNTVPLPGSTPQTGTLAGFVVPGNYPGPFPPGLFVNTNDGLSNPNVPTTDFAPRLGLAWQPTASNRWVIRTGAGFFYDASPGQSFMNVLEISQPGVIPGASPITLGSLANPVQPSPAIYPGPAGTAGWTTRWMDNSVPIPVICPAPTQAAPCSSGLAPSGVTQNMTVPLMYEWNLNTQYSFAHNWVLEVAYVGSHGIHQLPQSRAGAGLQGQGGSQIGYNLAPLAGPQCSSCALTGVTTSTAANVAERVPYLGVSPTSAAFQTNGMLKYNSAQITVRKQLSYGLTLQAAYTYARGFDTQTFGFNTYPYIGQVYEPNNNYHPNRFVINYVWNLPIPRYKGLLGRAVDNWSWSGVTTIQDGVPISITDNGGSVFFGGVGSGSTAQFCPGVTAADLATGGSIEDRVTSGLLNGAGYLNGKSQGVLCNAPYWNGTSFAQLLPGQTAPNGTGTGFGNMGGGIIKGPGQYNWDLALAKVIPIQEARSLQFRAEFFNVFNRAEFNIPNINANQSTFGQITGLVAAPRVIQFALKFLF